MGSGFGYCSMASANKTGNVDAALPPTAGGLASLSQYNVLPRTTIINERCRLPVVYGYDFNPLWHLTSLHPLLGSLVAKLCMPWAMPAVCII